MHDFSLFDKVLGRHLPPQVRNAAFGIIAVALSILFLDGWRSVNSYYTTLRESTENLESLAHVIAAQTETTFNLTNALLASNVAIMESGPLDTQARGRMRQSLVAAAESLQPNPGLIVLDDQGNSINSSINSMQNAPINYADREYYIYHKNHSGDLLFIGKPILRKSTKEWAITLSRRWNKPGGTFGGVVSASMNLTYFQDFFKTLQVGNNGALSIYLDSGVLLARRSPKDSQIGQNAAKSKEFVKYFSRGSAGTFRANSYFDAQERLHNYRHLKKYPVVVVASYGMNDIFAQLENDFLQHFIASIALIGILVLLGFRLIRQMKQRIADVIALQQSQQNVEKLNQELHLRTRQAEAASLSKSQFLANMSHEIRTPMNAILGMLQLLAHTQLSEKQKDYLGKVQIATGTLLSIINDILDFSKVEAGKMTLELQPFRFDHLLRDLAVILSASVGDKNIEILFNIDHHLPAHVIGDSLRLRQILLNLTGNAIKFTTHGEVVVTVRQHLPQPGPPSDPDGAHWHHIEFEVKDSGIGIAPDQLENIFTGFTQAETSTTRRFGGTGLGLAISQRLVQLHGGQLQVASDVGKGSRFYFSIRFQSLPPAKTLPEAWQSKVLHTLVVDDNQLARETLCEMASSLGWPVDSVASGKEALVRLQQSAAAGKPYELILMDWMMPDMDGWETAHQIRQQFLHQHMPIMVMVTAHARTLLEERCKHDPSTLDGFLFKPVTTASLLDVLTKSAAPIQDGAEAVAITRNQRLNGLRLLVVEDNALNQQVAQELLSSEGALVMLADNGQIALDILTSVQAPFDAVLMDIQMPVMDGYTATRKLRQMENMQDLVVIAMTANVLASDHAACLQAGMNDHIGKPFELSQLVGVIRQHVKQAPAIIALPVPATGPATGPTTGPATALAAATRLPLPDSIQALAAQHGIELERALVELNHNLPLLRTTLKIFTGDAKQMSAQIPALLAAQNRRELLHLLHTLKSSAAIVGAKQLAREASSAEETLKNGVQDDPAMSLMADGLSQLAHHLAQKSDIIERIVAAWSEPASTMNNTTTTTKDINHINDITAGGKQDRPELLLLIESLEASNMVALDQHQQLQPAFVALSPALAEALETAINQFNFSQATQICRQLLALLEGADNA